VWKPSKTDATGGQAQRPAVGFPKFLASWLLTAQTIFYVVYLFYVDYTYTKPHPAVKYFSSVINRALQPQIAIFFRPSDALTRAGNTQTYQLSRGQSPFVVGEGKEADVALPGQFQDAEEHQQLLAQLADFAE